MKGIIGAFLLWFNYLDTLHTSLSSRIFLLDDVLRDLWSSVSFRSVPTDGDEVSRLLHHVKVARLPGRIWTGEVYDSSLLLSRTIINFSLFSHSVSIALPIKSTPTCSHPYSNVHIVYDTQARQHDTVANVTIVMSALWSTWTPCDTADLMQCHWLRGTRV